MPNPSEADELRLRFIKAQRYRRFTNAWIYQVQPNLSRDVSSKGSFVGFMDTYDVTADSSYGVSLSDEHIQHWCGRFAEIRKTK